MPDSRDLHDMLLRLDSVHDPARFSNDLANVGIAKFGDDPAGFGEISQILNHLEHTLDETGGCIGTRLRDVMRQVL